MTRKEFEAQKALGITRKYSVIFEVVVGDSAPKIRCRGVWAADKAQAVLKVWDIKHRGTWTIVSVELAVD